MMWGALVEYWIEENLIFNRIIIIRFLALLLLISGEFAGVSLLPTISRSFEQDYAFRY
jgi:hypothetical protein